MSRGSHRRTPTSHPFAHAPRRMTSVFDRRRSGGRSSRRGVSFSKCGHGRPSITPRTPHWNVGLGKSFRRGSPGLHGEDEGWRGSGGTTSAPKLLVVNLIAEHDVEADEELAGESHFGLGPAPAMQDREVAAAQIVIGAGREGGGLA